MDQDAYNLMSSLVESQNIMQCSSLRYLKQDNITSAEVGNKA